MKTGNAMRLIIFAGAASLALIGCGQKSETAATGAEETESAAAQTPAPVEEMAPDYAAIAAGAVADPARPEEDRADDERRKPATALEFFQVTPGMTVFELEAGKGWYTELLSHAVGPDGTVIMQNPEAFKSFLGDSIDKRLADNRLPNVRPSYTNFDALDAADGSVDVATWVQGPHELFFKPEKADTLGDPAKSFAEIYRILKPGGVFTVIDHAAVAGAPQTTGHELHRIDKAIVVKLAKDAGFSIDAESDFLANPDDPLTVSVFDPSIRGYTNQFAIRFKKPE